MTASVRDTKTQKRSDGHARGSRNERNQRSRVAQLAARLIAEGLNDYGTAKRKAARRLGLPASLGMPDDTEVEFALRQYQSLFGNTTQVAAVRQLQQVALEAMELFDQFSPWLLGPVLKDTATAHSDIELEIIGVEPKIFEMYLLGKRLDFDLVAARSARQDPATHYVINYGPHQIRCTAYRNEAARLATASRTKIKQERAQLAEVQARFSTEKN